MEISKKALHPLQEHGQDCRYQRVVENTVDNRMTPFDRRPRAEPKKDLHSGDPLGQNYTCVILGEEGESGAPLHPVAGAGAMPRIRPRGLLPREGRFLARGQAGLCGLPGPDRMPELRAPARRALRSVGGHERTRAATPEADGVLTGEGGGAMATSRKTS